MIYTRTLWILNVLISYAIIILPAVSMHQATHGAASLASTRPATQPATQTSRGVVVLGTVCTADDSHPVSDATVWLSSIHQNGAEKFVTETMTNRVGAFCIDQYVSQGDYRISIRDEHGSCLASQSLTIAKADKPVLTVSLVAYKASLEGTIFDASGKPASGIVVVFVHRGTDDFFKAKSDKDGHYIVNHIADGIYRILPQVDLVDKDGMLRPLSDFKIDAGRVTKDIKLDRDAVGE